MQKPHSSRAGTSHRIHKYPWLEGDMDRRGITLDFFPFPPSKTGSAEHS